MDTTPEISNLCKAWNCYQSSCSHCFPEPNLPMTRDKMYGNGYLTHGLYASHLEYYLKYFPQESIKLVRYEDLDERGHAVILNEILEWVGVQGLTEEQWGEFKEINQPQEYPPMEPEEKKFLSDFFQEPNKKLYSMVGRNFGWQ